MTRKEMEVNLFLFGFIKDEDSGYYTAPDSSLIIELSYENIIHKNGHKTKALAKVKRKADINIRNRRKYFETYQMLYEYIIENIHFGKNI